MAPGAVLEPMYEHRTGLTAHIGAPGLAESPSKNALGAVYEAGTAGRAKAAGVMGNNMSYELAVALSEK